MRRIKIPRIRCCPKCGSCEVVAIVYGLPLESLEKAAEKGQVELGGCVIMEDSPDFRCKSCNAGFKR